MKILQINSTANRLSTGRIAKDIGDSILDLGWSSWLAYGKRANKGLSTLIKISNYLDYIPHLILSLFFDRHCFGSNYVTKKFIKKIDEINPNIIHIHNIHGYYINLDLILKYINKRKIPVVWTLHDCWLFTGHCAYFSQVNCYKWKKQCFDCPNKTAYPKSIFIDNSYYNFIKKKKLIKLENLDITFIPVSNWLGSYANESFLGSHKIEVIHNGIDTSIFHPQELCKLEYLANKLKVSGKFIILGCASPWSTRKGFYDFIQLRKLLLDDFEFILVGLNKEQINICKKNNIKGIKKTENISELATLYSLSDVFINPTYEDNFPTTNIEALSCGTPVITYNTGGSPEAIDKKTGYIVDQGDIKGLVNCILDIKVKGKDFFKTNCRNRAVLLFDKKTAYNKYIKIYKKINHEYN